MTGFWALRYSDTAPDSSFAEWADEMVMRPWVECPLDPTHNRGGGPAGDLTVILRRPPGNFVWTWNGDLLCSAAMKSRLEASGLTGLSFRPVTLRYGGRKKISDPGDYFQLRPIGWGGMPSAEAGLEELDNCPACRLLEYRIRDLTRIIDPAAWDGSDFFIVWPLPTFIFASGRAVEFFGQIDHRGVEIVPASEVQFGGNKFGPLPLSRVLPEPRAREIGEPLGIY
jgi:hypothetical protein